MELDAIQKLADLHIHGSMDLCVQWLIAAGIFLVCGSIAFLIIKLALSSKEKK